MALAFLTNLSPANGTIATWNWITVLKAAGWHQIADSDGTTYSSSGTQVTGSGTGAHGLGNDYAWVRLKAPTGTREILFQRRNGGDNRYWRIALSPAAGFVTGMPSATATPDATDMFFFAGGGTGGAPSFVIYWCDDAAYHQQLAADNANGFTWYNITYLNGTDEVQTITYMDALSSGTTATGDTDPYVYFTAARQSQAAGFSFLNSESSGPFGYFNVMSTPTLLQCPPGIMYTGGNIIVPSNLGSNSFTGNDDFVPLIYMRRSALPSATGYKGVSGYLGWKGSNRSTGDTLGTKSFAVFGDLVVPWDGLTTPAV